MMTEFFLHSSLRYCTILCYCVFSQIRILTCTLTKHLWFCCRILLTQQNIDRKLHDQFTFPRQSKWSKHCFPVNASRPRQTGRHFADDIFTRIFWKEYIWIPLKFHWSLLLWMLTILQHWFRYWFGVFQATSHYLNQLWLVYWRIYVTRPQSVTCYVHIAIYVTMDRTATFGKAKLSQTEELTILTWVRPPRVALQVYWFAIPHGAFHMINASRDPVLIPRASSGRHLGRGYTSSLTRWGWGKMAGILQKTFTLSWTNCDLNFYTGLRV